MAGRTLVVISHRLTSIRDAELLEYSLLRTIQDILAPVALSLFRISGGGESGAGGTGDNNTATDPTPVQQAGAQEVADERADGRALAGADNGRGLGGPKADAAVSRPDVPYLGVQSLQDEPSMSVLHGQ